VFVNQKRGAELLGKTLEKLGVRAVSLHGGKQQEAREYAVVVVALSMLRSLGWLSFSVSLLVSADGAPLLQVCD
jgi:hypothetical protein